MYKLILIIITAFIFVQCSSQEVAKNNVVKKTFVNKKSNSEDDKKALEHFIDGSIAESKGDYARAIIEFQDALRLDPNAGIYYSLAKNYFALNKLSLALQNSKQSVELDSQKVEYYELLSNIYSEAHQSDSAAIVLNKIIEIDSSNVNAYYRLARIYENNRPMEAIKIYEGLTNRIGPEWSVLVRVAELYEKLGNFDTASATIEQLLSLDPGNESLQKLLIESYLRAKNYDKALEMVSDILELTPDDLSARETKAQIYLAQNNWDAASKEYNFILDQPDVPLDAKLRIGTSYFNQSLKDSALLPVTKKFFEKIDKDTTDWQVKMYLGAIAINEGDDSTAIKNFKIVTDLARWNVEAWIRLGGLYFDNQKYVEASKVMNEAVEFFPEDFTVNLILGLSLSQDNKYSEAKAYLKKSVNLNPSDITALSAYGFALNQLKEYNEAINYLNKALQIKPDDVNLLGTLGLIYDSQEMWTQVDSVYGKALSIDSSNALVNNNYAYSLSERGIKLDEALRMIKIAIKADSNNSSYLDTYGWVFFKLGDYEQAKKYIEKAIDAGGESAVMLEHLGDILFKIGNKDSAKQMWQKAFDIDDSNNKLKIKIDKGEI
ncbi:MAG: tetratricopeptide repeat protein [Ignavibacteriaceae bacterium]